MSDETGPAGPASGVVSVAGQRLQAVPAAVPVPRDRPAAGTVVHRAGARVGRARRPRAAVRAARRRARPRHRDVACRPCVGAGGRRAAASWPPTSNRRCGPSSSTRRARCCRVITGSRTRPDSTRRAASNGSRWNSRTAPCCAASSTASTSHLPASCGLSTTRPGKAPPEARALAEFKAMFQMKFYAVALLRSRGVLPARLRLLYLVRRSGARLHPRSRRAPALREDVDGDLAGHPIRRRHRRFPAASVTAVRLVRPPHALSGVRRHSPAVSRLASGPRRG